MQFRQTRPIFLAKSWEVFRSKSWKYLKSAFSLKIFLFRSRRQLWRTLQNFLPECLEFLAQFTKTKKIFFPNFFPNRSSGHLPCNSARVSPNNKLDVRKVSAQNPRKNEKSFMFLSKWKSCGKLEVSSNSHAKIFLPRVQRLFAQTPKTNKKQFPPTIMFPSSDSSGLVRCSSDRLAQRFQPEVGETSAQNQEGNQKNIQFFPQNVFLDM